MDFNDESQQHQMTRQWLPPTLIDMKIGDEWNRYSYTIAQHVTPQDNTHYIDQACSAIFVSYQHEQKALYRRMDQLQTLIAVLKHENQLLLNELNRLRLNSMENIKCIRSNVRAKRKKPLLPFPKKQINLRSNKFNSHYNCR